MKHNQTKSWKGINEFIKKTMNSLDNLKYDPRYSHEEREVEINSLREALRIMQVAKKYYKLGFKDALGEGGKK